MFAMCSGPPVWFSRLIMSTCSVDDWLTIDGLGESSYWQRFSLHQKQLGRNACSRRFTLLYRVQKREPGNVNSQPDLWHFQNYDILIKTMCLFHKYKIFKPWCTSILSYWMRISFTHKCITFSLDGHACTTGKLSYLMGSSKSGNLSFPTQNHDLIWQSTSAHFSSATGYANSKSASKFWAKAEAELGELLKAQVHLTG